MFNRRPFQILLAVIAMVILLISPTFAIARTIIDQYFEAEVSASPGGS